MATRSPAAVVTAECFGQESDRSDTARCFRVVLLAFASALVDAERPRLGRRAPPPFRRRFMSPAPASRVPIPP
jgi:hypothetical protein